MALSLVELISSGSTGGGGVGLTCHTNNEIVKAAMFVQSLTSSGRDGGGGGNMGTKTLESGIVIPDHDTDVNSALEDGDTRIRDGRTSFALVVPFDMGILQTATLLLEGN
mmetsp:Transcript_37368/g.80648  ORF Transcript_37368/g.80648 Transcript_37368/m.80648 type:complete len:110 (-) Transcript_37368:138-467(-)